MTKLLRQSLGVAAWCPLRSASTRARKRGSNTYETLRAPLFTPFDFRGVVVGVSYLVSVLSCFNKVHLCVEHVHVAVVQRFDCLLQRVICFQGERLPVQVVDGVVDGLAAREFHI